MKVSRDRCRQLKRWVRVDVANPLNGVISGQLALKLFQETNDIETIFIQSNIVTVNFNRNLGSDISEVEETLKNFFVFYGEEE